MSYKLLTNLLFEPKGKHDPSLTYTIKDTVMSDDGSKVYFALKDVPAGIPLSDTEYWMLQMDLSASKNAMDAAAATAKTQTDAVTKSAQDRVDSMVDAAADAIANLNDYTEQYGLRVRGETAKASGNPVSFLPDAGSLLQPVTVLEPQQQGSGDPSPDNIRPFIGYDALKLTAVGKNLLPSFVESADYGDLALTKNPDGSVYVKGTCTEERVLTIYGGGSENIIGVDDCWVASSPGFGVMITRANGNTDYFGSDSFYLNPGDKVTWAYFHFHPGEVWDQTVYPQIELGTEITSYEPYQGTTHTVQIGQTVYGGRMDWLAGKLVAEWTMTALSGNEAVNREENINGSGNARFSISAAVPGIMPMPEANVGMQCSHYYTAFNPIGNNDRNACICGFQGMDTVFIRDDAHASVDEYKAYLAAQHAAGTPVQIAYKLATPIEIQLTPQIISAADPEQTNTLYGDGSIEVEYVKPLHVSIEERVAAALAAATE